MDFLKSFTAGFTTTGGITAVENFIGTTGEIISKGTETYPLMCLYHINFGYPMPSENEQCYYHFLRRRDTHPL
ncbi:MAG: aldose 1-epimerase family protein [Treponema sp.]|nr:aldose 1-epimerase family protein [Treponema sp.]